MTGRFEHSARRSGWTLAGAGKGHRYGKHVALLGLCVLFFAGCGETKVPEAVESPSVAVSGDGTVSVWQVGMFDKADYVLSELKDMAVEEAAEFNSASGKDAAVAVEKVEAPEGGNGKVVVEYRFDGWESCSAFLEEELFYGTVSDAFLKGRGKGIALNSVKDGTSLSEEQLRGEAAERYLIITDMKGTVYCPGKVTHVSSGASVNEDGSVDTSGAEGAVYILLK